MKLTSLYFSLLCLVLTGCDKNDTIKPGKGEKRDFNIVSYIEENGKVKPMSESRSIAGDLSSGYKLTGIITSFNYDPAAVGVSGLDRRIFWDTQTDINGKYEGEIRHWVTDGTTRHTFYAYSSNPVGTASGNGVTFLGGVSSSHTQPYVDFNQPDDPAKQIDLLSANPILNVITDNNVPTLNLFFRHRLSRVAIMLYGSLGATLYDCQAEIKYKTSAVKKNAGIVVALNQYINLTTSKYHSGTFKIGSGFMLPASANDIDNAIPIGDLILIPQPVPNAYLTLTIQYKLSAADATYQKMTVEFDGLELQCEKQYTYYLDIQEENASLTVTNVTLYPWITESTMVDELK